jgi:biotin carboxyl carrier protein
MKMENIIKAACACRVQEISVKEKETVQLNQPLIKLVKE